jgi:serine/threonine protein phosphatase PrpC
MSPGASSAAAAGEPEQLDTRCPECSEALLTSDLFCEACGHPVAASEPPLEHTGGRPEPVDPAGSPSQEHVELELEHAGAVSDRGLVHRHNEDTFALAAHDAGVVVVVCDGVSASAHSDQAARVAADAAAHTLEAMLEVPVRDDAVRVVHAQRAIRAAQAAVREVPMASASGRDAPSCTLVAAVWDGVAIATVSVGDSRAYWVGEHSAALLTSDDSWAQHQIDAGVMGEEQARRHANAHAITNWIGSDAPDGQPDVGTFVPDGAGRLVLCSDGLWGYLPTADMLAAIVRGEPDCTPIELARLLLERALQSGGHDNVTVAVVDVVPARPVPTSVTASEERP